MDNFEDIQKKIEIYGQTHVLAFYNDLSKYEQQKFLEQLDKIDLEQIKKIYEQTKEKPDFSKCTIEPMPYIDKNKIDENKFENYENIGKEVIKSNKLAVVTMAGGQGTRLGHNGPKGTYDIGLDSHKSIFELLCDKLKIAKSKYEISIPWYIMTSRENNMQTIDFFEQNSYFNYGRENIIFFIQEELPTLSMTGKLLLDQKGIVKEAANGHGGVFESMYKDNIIQDMKKRNIEWIYIGGVDNILAKMVDPLFLGVTIQNEALVSAKSVAKVNPSEKVGVFCKKDGKASIIEYSEISDELRNKRNEQGELVFGQANIVNHLFHISALDLVCDKKLPYHIAHKKCDYIDENGQKVSSNEPNALKAEMFMFDILQYFDNVVILQVPREEEFAPVKNADNIGVDCPKTARELFIAEQKRKEMHSWK